MKNSITNKEFFNQLAPEYDEMISFEKAVENKKKMFQKFLTPEMLSAADLGCGTGIDSIALSSLELKVDAFDPSSEMIKAAIENTKREGLKINFHNYSIDLIPDKFYDKFDFAISLGNTFANIEREKFNISLQNCFNLLNQGGMLIIQVLNYEKVIADKQRIVNITEGHEQFYIRFYDFTDEEMIFNIITFNKEKPSKYNLISTRLFPYTQEDFYSGLKEAGFSLVEFFSDFNLTTFNKEQSKDLVIRAVKA